MHRGVSGAAGGDAYMEGASKNGTQDGTLWHERFVFMKARLSSNQDDSLYAEVAQIVDDQETILQEMVDECASPHKNIEHVMQPKRTLVSTLLHKAVNAPRSLQEHSGKLQRQ